MLSGLSSALGANAQRVLPVEALHSTATVVANILTSIFYKTTVKSAAILSPGYVTTSSLGCVCKPSIESYSNSTVYTFNPTGFIVFSVAIVALFGLAGLGRHEIEKNEDEQMQKLKASLEGEDICVLASPKVQVEEAVSETKSGVSFVAK